MSNRCFRRRTAVQVRHADARVRGAGWCRLLGGLALLCAPGVTGGAPAALGLPAGPPAVRLESVAVLPEADGEQVRLSFSAPPPVPPQGFVMQAPPRIALDFPRARSALPRQPKIVPRGRVRAVDVIDGDGRTRVVLHLKQPARYALTQQGASWSIRLDPAPASTSALAMDPVSTATAPGMGATTEVRAAAPAASAEPAGLQALEIVAPSLPGVNVGVPQLQDIDFRRGEGGGGRVLVALPSDQLNIDVQQRGQSLVATFDGIGLAEHLRRRLDVTDFGTPVQFIGSVEVDGRVRMVVDMNGDWDFTSYQTGQQLVLDIRPRDAQQTRLEPTFSGERLSLSLVDVDIRSALKAIADFTEFNIVTSDAVTGTLTLRLNEVPWDQALHIILQAKGLGLRKTGSVLWIAPQDELLAKERAELEAHAAMRDLEPLITRTFQLNYTKASDVAAQLMPAGGGDSVGPRLLSARGSVAAEPRTNQLFVSDIPAKVGEVQQLLMRLDVPVRQVLIEARIVEARDTFGRSLGVRLGATDLRGVRGGTAGHGIGGGNRLAWGNNYGNVIASTGQGGTLDASSSFVNLPATSDTMGSVPTFAFSIFSAAANRFLNLELSALEADGNGKVVSSPRVVTADQSKALIEQGTEIPYQEATSSGATSTSFRKANLKLEVTPQITPEGNIIMDLSVNKDSVGQKTDNGFAIDTKHVQTQVLVENGGTVVIGGIYEMSETRSTSKVPLLGDIPVLGHLFKSQSRNTSKQEMLVFITPRVVSDLRATR